MTSRRGTLVEEGARELLQVNGYTVRVVPPGVQQTVSPSPPRRDPAVGRDAVHPHPEILALSLHCRYNHGEMRP